MSTILENHVPRALSPTETNSIKITSNLSSMPHEIKAIIVHWLYLSSQINHILRRHLQYNIPHDSIGFSSLEPHDESTDGFSLSKDSSLIDIQSLACVSRTFYELCRPYLFERVEFYGCQYERMIFTLEDIMERHSYFVRNIWWRSPKSCQSDLLLELLKACPRATYLDVDLDTRQQIIQTTEGSLWSHRHCLMDRFIKHTSQMVALTHLCLSPVYDQPRFTEDFVVSVLSNLRQLQSFTCAGIGSSVPKNSTDHQSTVGLLLASLPHLTRLVLDDTQCFDATWSQLDWSSSLKELNLKNCNQVSMTTLHRFTQLSASTLTKLSLHNVPIYHDEDWCDDRSLEFMRNRIRFGLPKLTILEMSSELPIAFFKAFQASENISLICLHRTPNLRRVDIEKLIQDRFWPALQKLQVTRRTAYFTPARIRSLRSVCHKSEVRLHLDTRVRIDEDEPEAHALEMAMSVFNAGRNNSPIDEGLDDDADW